MNMDTVNLLWYIKVNVKVSLSEQDLSIPVCIGWGPAPFYHGEVILPPIVLWMPPIRENSAI